MTDKELRKMSRAELLELLIEQMEENERLRSDLKKAILLLRDRQIRMAQAGSIAQAALELNHVFAAADEAARQYVESIRLLADEKLQQIEERVRPDEQAKESRADVGDNAQR